MSKRLLSNLGRSTITTVMLSWPPALSAKVGEAPGQLQGRRAGRLAGDERPAALRWSRCSSTARRCRGGAGPVRRLKRAELRASFGRAGAEPAGDAVPPSDRPRRVEGHGAGLDLLLAQESSTVNCCASVCCQPVGRLSPTQPTVTSPWWQTAETSVVRGGVRLALLGQLRTADWAAPIASLVAASTGRAGRGGPRPGRCAASAAAWEARSDSAVVDTPSQTTATRSPSLTRVDNSAGWR